MLKKLNTQIFIERAKQIHGDKYDYSFVNYINSSTKVQIICPEHGVFEQLPSDHLVGKGCQKCARKVVGNKLKGKKRALPQSKINELRDEFIKNARLKHGDKYDYSKVEYVNNKTPVIIICPIHGEFEQRPNTHLNGKDGKGSGCPKCAKVSVSKMQISKRKTTEQFIEEANIIHENKYDYSKTIYKTAKTKVIIICPIHGDFEQTPNAHLNGQGCPKCANKNVTTEEFIEKARKIHGDKYDYSKVNYVNSHEKICVICSKHGEFYIRPCDHLHQNQGCPVCSESKGEKIVSEFLKNNNISYVLEYPISIDKSINSSGIANIDFYLPDYNMFIEYNGIQHYIPIEHFGGKLRFKQQQKRDEFVRNYCKENDIKLIEIRYDENIEDKLNNLLI